MFRSVFVAGSLCLWAACVLSSGVAHAIDGRCVNGGGEGIPCEPDPPPPPVRNDAPPDYGVTPISPTLAGQLQNYRYWLSNFSPYFDVSYFSNAADAQTELELSARLDHFYSYAWQIYGNRAGDTQRLATRALDLGSANASLLSRADAVRAVVARSRSEITALEYDVRTSEDALNKVETQAAALKTEVFYLHNDFKQKRTLLSYFAVFGRDSKFLQAHRLSGQAEYTEAERNWRSYDKSTFQPLGAAGFAAAPASSGGLQPAGFAAERAAESGALEARAPIDDKLAAIGRLNQRFRNNLDEQGRLNRRIANLTNENASLTAGIAANEGERDRLSSVRDALGRRLMVARHFMPLAVANRKTAAQALAKEVLVSFAKDEALDRTKEAIDNLLGVSGIASAIPTNAEDLVVKAATEGRRVLIPAAGFKKQWDAFLKVQAQTATLVERSQGFVSEAAHLCAQGTPAEIAAHVKKVFGHVETEAADYTLKVGLSDLPEEQAGPFEKALQKLLDARKATDG